jgi:hypothetical protein
MNIVECFDFENLNSSKKKTRGTLLNFHKSKEQKDKKKQRETQQYFLKQKLKERRKSKKHLISHKKTQQLQETRVINFNEMLDDFDDFDDFENGRWALFEEYNTELYDEIY